MFQGLDKKAQGWLIRILVIIYDYFTYKYDPDKGLTNTEIVALLAKKTNSRETDIIEAIQTLKALRLMPDYMFPDTFAGDGDNQYK